MRSEAGLPSVPSARGLLGTVAACAANPQQRARIIDALRNHADVCFADSFAELSRLLRGTIDAFDVVIVPPHDVAGTDAGRIVREIATERPRVAIVAYCQAGSQYSTDIRALAAAGVHQFVFNGIDDNGVAFRAVVAAARRACAAECVMQQLAPLISPPLHPFMEAVLGRPDAITTIVGVAGALGVHRKTLFNWCARAGVLPPAELLAWCRLALAAYHLESTGCTVDTIAIELSYPSDTALRNTMKRHTGLRASDIRHHGGVACVVRALERRLGREDDSRRELHVV